MRHNSVHERREDALRGDARHGDARQAPLVVATSNPGKLREFRALLSGLPYEVVSQGERGVVSVEETGRTFFENALLKARHAAQTTLCAAIADDSGLEVDALGGAPGVFSARYAGDHAGDDSNNLKLMDALAGVPAASRTARYRCVLVFLQGPLDTMPLAVEGVWDGLILAAPRGSSGFGYDPYFWLPERGMTAAEMQPAEKNLLSHRGIALRELRRLLAARGHPAAPFCA